MQESKEAHIEATLQNQNSGEQKSVIPSKEQVKVLEEIKTVWNNMIEEPQSHSLSKDTYCYYYEELLKLLCKLNSLNCELINADHIARMNSTAHRELASVKYYKSKKTELPKGDLSQLMNTTNKQIGLDITEVINFINDKL